jgi:5-methylcytosine-specific restriction endonuclease McrA
MNKLLTRDEFREAVFARDKHKCVFCGSPAVDAHHILERRLFDNYGDFKHKVAKVVRKGHVQSAKHWFFGQKIERNHLAGIE